MGGLMKLAPTALQGVYVASSTVAADHRGAFERLYCERELAPALGSRRIVQVNHSRTAAAGAVRGMHLQRQPHAEMKFVRCLRGRVWDVVVDLRAGSSTLLQSHAEELTGENGRMMIIPEGCAHGFQALEPQSEMLYLHTAFYEPASELGFSCVDESLNLRWPLPIVDLSQRDATHPLIADDFSGLAI
jgi:dTDP-4-dehydrorhamnose 3,5-epimerase